MNRKLRMGMVGGGPDAFIGSIHRMAAQLDGQIELVCGAFSGDAAKSKSMAALLHLPPGRVYGSFAEMFESEALLADGEKMDFVSVVTPNHLHFEPCRMAMEAGFDVVCDKPLAYSLEEAKMLQEVAARTNRKLIVTYTYTGYPMVREARFLVHTGKIGTVRKVVVQYPQGWLANAIENEGNKQASWRTDPRQAGKAGCMGDIGTHAANLAEFVTGLKIKELAADLTTFAEGRLLDDDGTVLLRFANGAKGVLMATQIGVGEENNLKMSVYGEHASLHWEQEQANTLLVKYNDRPAEIYRTGNQRYLGAAATAATRLPPGHPEGYLEAFANLYLDFANQVRLGPPGETTQDLLPTIEDGVRGMAFTEAVVTSAHANAQWVRLLP